MGLGSRYFYPLANTSGREVLMMMLRSPVIMWPAIIHMNGEQGFDMISSILSEVRKRRGHIFFE
jgi:hypothetical protein